MKYKFSGWPLPGVGRPYGTQVVTPTVFSENYTQWEALAEIRNTINKIVKALNSVTGDFQELANRLSKDFQELDALVSDFDQRITDNADSIVRARIDLQEYTLEHVETLRARMLELLEEYRRDTDTYVFDWVVGAVGPLQTAVDNMYDYLRPHAFTAIEFDAYGFTAEEFDNMLHSVREFETHGKMLFPRTDEHHAYSPYTGRLGRWDHLIYEIHNELRANDGRAASDESVVSNIDDMTVIEYERN